MIRRIGFRQKAFEGFTLIEVMVALIVVAVGILALASFQGELFFSSVSRSRRRSTVSHGGRFSPRSFPRGPMRPSTAIHAEGMASRM